MTTFLTRGRAVALTAAVLAVVGLAALSAIQLGRGTYCSDGPVQITCPADPAGPSGQPVADTFTFVHRPLGPEGTITVHLASMTGIITYPPPRHDTIVEGLVPWAKAGVIVKADLRQGSPYAALALTGSHGIRLQWNYEHDTATDPADARWLRLTRSASTVRAEVSTDARTWEPAGEVTLDLPATAQVGLFTTSPSDVTLRRVALGAGLPEARFTQASATFDHLDVTGAGPGGWRADSVGVQSMTDWEKYHRAPGLITRGDQLVVTGAGDISPGGHDGWYPVERLLIGVVLGLSILMIAAVRGARSRPAVPALLAGGAAVVVGLVSVGVALLLGTHLLQSYRIPVLPTSAMTHVRLVAGTAAMLGLGSVLALAVGTLIRRTWIAALTSLLVLPVPYLVAVLPLLPDTVADWLLRATPAAGFAVLQTVVAHDQVVAHHTPLTGYYPLTWWAGLTVLGAYTSAALLLAHLRNRPGPAPPAIA